RVRCSLDALTDSAYSNVVTLSPPSITTQPADATAVVGTSVTLTAAASGTPTPTLQWQKGGVNLTNGVNISGATSNSLTLSGLLVADSGNYRVVASNGILPDATSNIAVLTVTKANQTITFGALAGKTFVDAPFTVTATASS